ncbi:MAG TPA: ABC transporter ATP-binding protein [Longimicrobiaceae bacterium]|nr:ABC transporter ATP-binding protein [Longimicrobiaceae bacterium]
MTEALAADGVGKSFGERRVLSAASVWVSAGQVVALFGRNGAGKSTLIRIVLGLMAADHGQVRFRGKIVERPKLHRLAADGLFYLPAEGLLSRRISVGEHFRRMERRFGTGDAGPLIARLDVGGFMGRMPGQLSTGQRRRVEIALALLRRPACLVADEPFAGIAPADAEAIGDELRALASTGCAVLITGHEVAAVMRVADTVVWMTSGTAYTLGPPAEAMKHHGFKRDYLGPGTVLRG